MRVAGEAIARQAGIENRDLAAGAAELQGGGQAGKAAADDDDVIQGNFAISVHRNRPLAEAKSAVACRSMEALCLTAAGEPAAGTHHTHHQTRRKARALRV